MRFGVVAKLHRLDFTGQLREILTWLAGRGCEAIVDAEVAACFGLEGVKRAGRQNLPESCDVIIVFGGDGTLLSVARTIRDSETPILGVNLGSLGFLTEVTLDELYPSLERLIGGDYSVDQRSMIQAEVQSGQGKTIEYHALNDVVINKGALARIINMQAYCDREFISNFLADGMIVATPTGSTAYSLSAGGPIIHPSVDSFIMTPICPHTLTNRPLVVPSASRLRIVLQSGEDVMLTVDGQVGQVLHDGDTILCTRSPFRVGLVQPGERSYFEVLRRKLKWGER